MLEDTCYFMLGDNGIFESCKILRVTSCPPDCKFRKTAEEFDDGIRKADERLQQLGLTRVVQQVSGGENIVTAKRVSMMVDCIGYHEEVKTNENST